MLGPFAMRRRFPWNIAFFASVVALVLTMHASVAADIPAAFAATGDTNEVAKLIASGAQGSDYAGSSIAVSGDTAVLGAYRRDVGGNVDQGVAVVFVRNGASWTEQTELTASDGAAGHGFGFSVDISGDTVVVGGAVGAAYVFVRTGTTWTQQQKLTPPAGSETSWGRSVAVDDDTVVVGGWGSAHVFSRTESTWGAPQTLTAIGGLESDEFGASVAVDGDTVIVSAPRNAWIVELDSASPGMAFVFVRGESNWTQQQKLTPSDGDEGDRFGHSVDISGNTVVVGAKWSNPGGNVDQGSAYVYYRSGTAWSQQAKLTASDGVAFDLLGVSVAISGGTIVVGATGTNQGTVNDVGSAYVYERNGTSWTQDSELVASDPGVYFLGTSVSIDASTIVVGGRGIPASAPGYVFALPAPLPIVFVPGIAGSVLVDRADANAVRWFPFSISAMQDMTLFGATGDDDFVAPDVLRKVSVGPVDVEIVYETFLDGLAAKGLREYDLNTGPLGDYASFVPGRLTSAGCDFTQTSGGEKPNLFLFPYDWRQDNTVSAAQLDDYIDCVLQFYPGSDINLVTHSMGGLVGRRYVLDNPTHHIEKWISIAAPWLGAPKLVHVLETGLFIDQIKPLPPVKAVLKDILASFPGAHQLLPSQAYFDLGGASVIFETGIDLDGNGLDTNLFSGQALFDLVDDRYGKNGVTPGTTGKVFHTVAQDDWRSDSSGIEFFHIIGRKSAATTIERFTMKVETVCLLPSFFPGAIFSCSKQEVADLRWTVGDGTVPLLSAERKGSGLDYNTPGAKVLTFTSTSVSTDPLVDHNGLMSYGATTTALLDILAGGDGEGTAEPTFATTSAVSVPGSVDYHYITVIGANDVIVRSGSGGSTEALNDVAARTIPGVQVLSVGTAAYSVLIPASGAETYDIEFDAPSGAIKIEVMTGDGASFGRMVRYNDVGLPGGAPVKLGFAGTTIDDLVYDADNNGSYESAMSPTLDATGGSIDEDGPVVTVTDTPLGGLDFELTIGATDTSGVAGIAYSTDGVTFRTYEATLTIDQTEFAQVTIMADDAAGNRTTSIYTLSTTSVPLVPALGPWALAGLGLALALTFAFILRTRAVRLAGLGH